MITLKVEMSSVRVEAWGEEEDIESWETRSDHVPRVGDGMRALSGALGDVTAVVWTHDLTEVTVSLRMCK